MNIQTFTAERLNEYRREDLHSAAAAVRSNRVDVGSASGSRFNLFTTVKVTLRKRLTGGLRPASHSTTVVAGR